MHMTARTTELTTRASIRELIETESSSDAGIFELATCSDVGNERENNEDFVGYSYLASSNLVMAIADGVGGCEGGELASKLAVEVLVSSYREQSPRVPAEKRLYRAAQQANIEIYDKAIVVPELRGMSTTLTAIAFDGGLLHAIHVGDSRLYRVHGTQVTQLTKDHTLLGDRIRRKAMSRREAQQHADHGVLTRSLGRELIAAVDRISFPIAEADTLLLCTDGLYNVLGDDELLEICRLNDARRIARVLIEAANDRGTHDNLTVGVCRVCGALPTADEAQNWVERLRHWIRS